MGGGGRGHMWCVSGISVNQKGVVGGFPAHGQAFLLDVLYKNQELQAGFSTDTECDNFGKYWESYNKMTSRHEPVRSM